MLVLRSDMTVPIARVVATRYAQREPPLRFCYFAHAYRGVRPQRGQPRELLQAGIELIGSPAPEGTAEALTRALPRARRRGPARLPRRARRRLAVPRADGEPAGAPRRRARACSRRSSRRDFVGLERERRRAGLPGEAAELLLDVPQRAAAPRCSTDAPGPAAEAVTGMRRVHELLEPRRAPRG